jgi:hypothetical protein
MSLLTKILAALVVFLTLGAIWASLAGWGAKQMKGAAHYEPSVRSGSAGHSRVYYHGGKY